MTAARITKRTVVLELAASPDPNIPKGDFAMYSPGPEMESDLPELLLLEADFTALGSPERITVTISPEGDPT